MVDMVDVETMCYATKDTRRNRTIAETTKDTRQFYRREVFQLFLFDDLGKNQTMHFLD